MTGLGGRRGPLQFGVAACLLLGACIPEGAKRSYNPEPYTPPPKEQDWERGSADDVRALPAPPPAWVAKPVTADAKLVTPSSYVVQPGDTLRRVADRTGSGSEAIARANGISAPFMIRVGQRLAIPGGRFHLVRSGETGIAIARAYGVPWSRVVAANALEEPYILRTGQRIVIPEAGGNTLAERASAFRIDVDDIVTGSQPAIAERARPATPSNSSSRVLAPTEAVAAPTRSASNFLWPAKGRIVRRFGPGASGERNDGIKIALPLDTPVLASADGVVAYVGSDIASMGGLVILKHGGGWTSVYGHAAQLLVQRGQSVKRGQVIARSGDSGSADRPELHFELRQGRTPVDPLPRLPAR